MLVNLNMCWTIRSMSILFIARNERLQI
jgi:hypothetical protein